MSKTRSKPKPPAADEMRTAYDSYNKGIDAASKQFKATVATAKAVHKAGMDAIKAISAADENAEIITDYDEEINRINRGMTSTIAAARRSYRNNTTKLLVWYDEARREPGKRERTQA